MNLFLVKNEWMYTVTKGLLCTHDNTFQHFEKNVIKCVLTKQLDFPKIALWLRIITFDLWEFAATWT